MTETSLMRMLMSMGYYVAFEGNFRTYISQILKYRHMFFSFMVPSGLYLLVDVIVLTALQAVDPRTLTMLGSLKIVGMGFVWSIFFRRKLSSSQWAGLILISFGCGLDQLLAAESQNITEKNPQDKNPMVTPLVAKCLILLEIILVIAAAVYFELLVKRHRKLSINVQSFYMYSNSFLLGIVFKVAAFVLFPSERDGASESEGVAYLSLKPWLLGYEWRSVSVVCLLSFGGVLTSVFMKRLDSVRKTIGMACQIVTDAVLGVLILHIPLRAVTVVASTLVAGGVILYSRGINYRKRVVRSARAQFAEVEDRPHAHHHRRQRPQTTKAAHHFLGAVGLQDLEHAHRDHASDHDGEGTMLGSKFVRRSDEDDSPTLMMSSESHSRRKPWGAAAEMGGPSGLCYSRSTSAVSSSSSASSTTKAVGSEKVSKTPTARKMNPRKLRV
eukprot:CAMPEP_0184492864 /NCGR_PEP_ID=MMETSP0113_2-20130426/24432_1 /TAXON_ID=91329 /ORGANISM="Norrisiella sphaerica, Strain BC52" /LENGTH=441 /DNA_ID=CAMNT_0026877879 /DNA_START=194 /DNA_END=1519 /DNA_ORIENTATION=+